MPVIENKSGGSISSEHMIRRLWYPPTEYTENLSNINLAIGMLGGPDNGERDCGGIRNLISIDERV